MGMNLLAFDQSSEFGASFEDTGESELIGMYRAGTHLLEQKKGFVRGLLVGEGSDNDIVSGRFGFLDFAKNGERVVQSVGKNNGGGFEEVFGEGRVEDEAGFDEMGMDLVEVPAAPAFLKDCGFRVFSELGDGGCASYGFGGNQISWNRRHYAFGSCYSLAVNGSKKTSAE